MRARAQLQAHALLTPRLALCTPASAPLHARECAGPWHMHNTPARGGDGVTGFIVGPLTSPHLTIRMNVLPSLPRGGTQAPSYPGPAHGLHHMHQLTPLAGPLPPCLNLEQPSAKDFFAVLHAVSHPNPLLCLLPLPLTPLVCRQIPCPPLLPSRENDGHCTSSRRRQDGAGHLHRLHHPPRHVSPTPHPPHSTPGRQLAGPFVLRAACCVQAACCELRASMCSAMLCRGALGAALILCAAIIEMRTSQCSRCPPSAAAPSMSWTNLCVTWQVTPLPRPGRGARTRSPMAGVCGCSVPSGKCGGRRAGVWRVGLSFSGNSGSVYRTAGRTSRHVVSPCKKNEFWRMGF
jgi:hypothetical protein